MEIAILHDLNNKGRSGIMFSINIVSSKIISTFKIGDSDLGQEYELELFKLEFIYNLKILES